MKYRTETLEQDKLKIVLWNQEQDEKIDTKFNLHNNGDGHCKIWGRMKGLEYKMVLLHVKTNNMHWWFRN